MNRTCFWTILFAPFLALPSYSQTFPFNEDDQGPWELFDPLNSAGVAPEVDFSFADGRFRIVSPPPAIPDAGPARAFAYLPDKEYTDFYCAVDVYEWDDSVDQAFGILARARNIGLGSTTGYVCNYNPNQTGSRPGGQFQINLVTGEASEATLAIANIKLIAGLRYRMVFTGVGGVLTASLYDVENLAFPVSVISTDAAVDERAGTYPEGAMGVFNFCRVDDVTLDTSIADTSFDNFVVAESNPWPEGMPGIERGLAGYLHVTDISPEMDANFYRASEGLSCRVVSRDDAKIESIGLTINGADVSTDADIDPASGSVAYNKLEADTNYEAEIRATSTAGVESVYRWRFNTFDESLITAGEYLVIEAEDYNFDSGDYLPNPLPSGYLEDGSVVNREDGYVDRVGTPDVDFQDTDMGPLDDNDYRLDDHVGIRKGSNDVEPSPILNDAPRVSHLQAGIGDHQLRRSVPGEWLNYTRDFPEGEYRIYLRAAARWPQDVMLSKVTSDRSQPNQTTADVGVFSMPNTVTPQDFIFVPLTSGGEETLVELSGEDTLRLTLGGDPEAFELQRTLYLNYLLLVPVSSDDPNLAVTRSGVFKGGSAETVPVSITNTGKTQTLTISDAVVRGENAGLFSVLSRPDSLAPGESGVMELAFTPGASEGLLLAELALTSNDQSHPEIVVDLATSVPRSNGLVARYPLDETDGGVFADASGNRIDGRFVSVGDGSVTIGELGINENAVRFFQGSGAAFAEVPALNGVPELNSFTISLWVSPDNAETGTFLSKGTGSPDPFAMASAGGSVVWATTDGAFQLPAENILTTGEYTHLAVTVERGESDAATVLYADGKEVARDDASALFNDSRPAIFQLGALNGENGFAGLIDEVQVYNRALSDTEVAFLQANPGEEIGGGPVEPSDLRILSISRSQDSITLQWLSAAGNSYVVEYSPDLELAGWSAVATVAATGAISELNDMDAGRNATGSGYYRVREE